MFEREIQFIYDFNSNKVKKAGNYISLNQLQKVEIHPAIFQYIIGEIDFLVFEDRQKLLKDSVFDYTIPSVFGHLKAIGEEVKKNKKFSVSYIDKLIQHASSFIVSYLCKPNWTLMKFIFEDDNEKSTSEINQILNYLFYYPHIRKVISGYFEKKKLKVIRPAEFMELLDKINSAGLETNYSRIIDESIDSICDFFNTGVFKKNLIPLKAVEYFLTDRKLISHAGKIVEYYGEEPFQKVNAGELKDFLKKILIEKTEYLEEPEESVSEKFESVESTKEFSSNQIISKDSEQNQDNTKVDQVENEIVSADESTVNEFEAETEDENNLTESAMDDASSIEESIQQSDGNETCETKELKTEDSNTIIEITKNADIVKDNDINAETQSEPEEEFPDGDEPASEMDLFETSAIAEEESESAINDNHPVNNKEIDISEILNDKKMSKILDVVFDYDVEEFSNTIEKICRCKTDNEAFLLIDGICEKAGLNSDSKEAKIFKTVISKFYS